MQANKRQVRWASAAQLAAAHYSQVKIVQQTYLSSFHLSSPNSRRCIFKTLSKDACPPIPTTTPATCISNASNRPTELPDNNRRYLTTMSDNTFFVLQLRTSNIRMLKYFLVWFAIGVVVAFVVGGIVGVIAGVVLHAAVQRQQYNEVMIDEDGGWGFRH